MNILITGSGGLVGSEAVRYFSALGHKILGIDNNHRKRWFGDTGSVASMIEENKRIPGYKHLPVDICDFESLCTFIDATKPAAIIHCAGQPSHEKSAKIPYEDFQSNTVGTVNLLETARRFVPNSPFIFTSTNKVYGDKPNQLPMVEYDSRYELHNPDYDTLEHLELHTDGICEFMSIDNSIHSPFGANKTAADIIVQEYGQYYEMNTVCFRCGCITGKNHQGVEQHGFLSHLCKTAKSGKIYTIYGHAGKQVRDNIHAYDLVTAFDAFIKKPRKGIVYNIGGGRDNSCSIIEAIRMIKEISGIDVQTNFGEARKGDHICYYTNNSRFKAHYRDWKITRSLKEIIKELL